METKEQGDGFVFVNPHMREGVCPLCMKKALEPVEGKTAVERGKDGFWRVVRCGSCGVELRGLCTKEEP